MTTNDINDMMLCGERINIEYKEATNELPKSVWETYSSFANTIGGTIILGIKEHRNLTFEQGRFEVTGVNDPDKILKSFWDTITTLAEMKDYYGEETYNRFTANEQQVMAYVWNGDSVSNMELQQMLGMNSLEIGKLLHNMVEKKLLNQESKNRWTTYTINKNITLTNGCEVKNEKSTLTKAENDVLNLIKQNTHITYAEIGETLSFGETSVYKIIKHLKEKNLIHRNGGRVYGYWVINNNESSEK